MSKITKIKIATPEQIKNAKVIVVDPSGWDYYKNKDKYIKG